MLTNLVVNNKWAGFENKLKKKKKNLRISEEELMNWPVWGHADN